METHGISQNSLPEKFCCPVISAYIYSLFLKYGFLDGLPLCASV
jgi:hypothetical protein